MRYLNVVLILGNDWVLTHAHHPGRVGQRVGAVALRPDRLGDLGILNVFVVDRRLSGKDVMIVVDVVVVVVLNGRHYEIVAMMAAGVDSRIEFFGYHVAAVGREATTRAA